MTVNEQLKHAGDVISVVTISATLMTWLPPVAALLTVIWSAIRIYETRTVQKFFGKTRKKRTRETDKRGGDD